jgi:hypothetical protein
LESVDEILQCIISTGYYLLCFDVEAGVGKGQMFLHYKPSCPQSIEVNIDEEEWNSERIRDFVRKLGFLDKEKAQGGIQIKRFLSLNQVSGQLALPIVFTLSLILYSIGSLKIARALYEAE